MLKKLDNVIHALNRYNVNTRIIKIIFNIYIAQINIQEDMIKCALHIKIESKLLCYLFTILNLQENAKVYTIGNTKKKLKIKRFS